MFTLGKFLIGVYLGTSSLASSYGAAGSVIVLLLWVYYSAQVVLLGAEFTREYVKEFGRKPPPSEFATKDPAPPLGGRR
jgi:membrane protein